jgi:hypothetical protein
MSLPPASDARALDKWHSWLFRSRFRRRSLMKFLRVFLRLQRATLANAILVIRRPDGCVLAFPSQSGELRLPFKELDGWKTVTSQVEEWLEQLLHQRQAPELVAIEGTPGRQGVTFLYSAKASLSYSEHSDGIWLDPDGAPPTLRSSERRLLLLANTNSRPFLAFSRILHKKAGRHTRGIGPLPKGAVSNAAEQQLGSFCNSTFLQLKRVISATIR